MIELNVQEVFPVHSEPITLSNPIVPEIWKQWFQAWGKVLACDLPVASDYELTLRLTGDQEIQSLNAQYRHKNQPTDVLAFATLEWNFPTIAPEEQAHEPLYLGDIIISLETASKQAQQQGHPLQRELAWLAGHGFLHLLGWDHPDEGRLQAMLQKQETLLKFIGL
ncbi:rRNA maturation RNase YbeY [Crocosphaera sp.]|uniref:rRNA maturation RNase YbeY n=1 Tax=Crocosphaera sp. TaxID=2729996 RepID=UPI003F295536|nr:rRNA maturation RNase YbeY [Crocosphaera sp.]